REGAWGQAHGADIGYGGGVGPGGGWPFVVAAARQAGEPLLAQEDGEGVDTEGVAGGQEFALDVVDGQILLAQGDNQCPHAIPCRGLLGGGGGQRGEAQAVGGVQA